MILKRFFIIFLTAVFLSQTLSVIAFAQEKYTCEDTALSTRLKKEKLVITRTLSKLSAETAKPGDIFKFKVLEDIVYGNKVIIPCDSIIEGKVINSRKKLIFRADAYIDILIKSIQNNSTCINLEKEAIIIRIADPRYKGLVRRTLQRGPIVACNTAASIALTSATNLSGGVIFAIVAGVGAVTGFVSGFIDPDVEKTRMNGAIVRSVEGTPVGTFLITVEQGFDVKFPESCVVVIKFDDKTREKFACALQNSAVTVKY